MASYADIVLPLAQPTYTYAIPEGLSLEVGDGVLVQFGHRKFYTAIVWRLHDVAPKVKRVKNIIRKLYDVPLLSRNQIEFWQWLSDYYICSLGEVMRVALPSMVKPSADSEQEFEGREYRPRQELYISLLGRDEALEQELDRLQRRAPKQYEVLMHIEQAIKCQADIVDCQANVAVPRTAVDVDLATLRSLEKKGFLSTEWRAVKGKFTPPNFALPTLSEHQLQAFKGIKSSFYSHATTLLQGVTSSGKTEIYIHLISEALQRGGDVLMLVPEIALTGQLVERLRRVFGERVTPYHSRLSARARGEVYLRLASSSGGEFVVGVRSSIFLPLKNLQLIIVDEEHDTSYKQSEPAPRYSARDCAVYLAHQLSINTLLGSATPSLESWLNAESGRYGKAQLTERYAEGVSPQIIIRDRLRSAKRGELKMHFDRLLLSKIEERLERREQVILFQNRRGFAPYVECGACGWRAECPNCNVSMSYHKASGDLRCHYCSYTTPLPKACPKCGEKDIAPQGFGTEKIEEQISQLFPAARVARLDSDIVASQGALRAIIDSFERGDIDILVGTQIITKGFDFGGVSLVGILNADNLLHNPDFRASERAFQLLSQVSGRAGRRRAGGEVIIQTSEPNHPILQQVVDGDYLSMAHSLLSEREAFSYPPYARLTLIVLRHSDQKLLFDGASMLASELREKFGRRLLGPISPPIDRVRGEWVVNLLLKIEAGASSSRARQILKCTLDNFSSQPQYRTINLSVDVDPQ